MYVFERIEQQKAQNKLQNKRLTDKGNRVIPPLKSHVRL